VCYEDLNGHDSLRKDLHWQTAAEEAEELASCSTLCRLENRAGRKEAWLIHEVVFDQFADSFDAPPAELLLDFAFTDDQQPRKWIKFKAVVGIHVLHPLALWLRYSA
jgi:hypothetical protein